MSELARNTRNAASTIGITSDVIGTMRTSWSAKTEYSFAADWIDVGAAFDQKSGDIQLALDRFGFREHRCRKRHNERSRRQSGKNPRRGTLPSCAVNLESSPLIPGSRRECQPDTFTRAPCDWIVAAHDERLSYAHLCPTGAIRRSSKVRFSERFVRGQASRRSGSSCICNWAKPKTS